MEAEIRYGCGRPADVLQTRAASLAEYAAARSGVHRARVGVIHFDGHGAGPAFLGTSFANQRLYVLLGVGKHYEENEVAPGWTWALGSCVELEGDGDGEEFHPVNKGQRRTG